MIFRGLVRALCALFILGGLAVPAGAETAADFYTGKVVRLVVGYGAGGGYDTYARMLAPHLEKRLGAKVVVENRPGGGGIVALNQVSAAKPDGLTIMLVSASSSTFSQLIEAEGVRYDVRRLGILGRVIDEKRAFAWSAAAPYRTVEDAQNSAKPIRFGGTSRTDTLGATSAFLAEALALNAQIIVGYKGTKEVSLAAVRGEIDGFALSDSSARKYGKDGSILPFVIISRERSRIVPDIPTIFEVAELSPAQAWWMDYCDALLGLGRALVTAPDLPADRLTYLQAAVKDVLTDRAVVAEAEAKKRPLNYASPEKTREQIAAVIGSLTPEEIARVRHVAQEKFR